MNKQLRGISILNPIDFAEKGSVPKRIQLVPIGDWGDSAKGTFQITKAMCDQMVENFERKIRAGVDINIEHMSENGAAGWVKKVESADDGLYGEVEWTPMGEEKVKNKEYKFISPEIDFLHFDPETGAEYTNVLIGAAITNRPFFKQLQHLNASEFERLTNDNGSVVYYSHTVMNIEELLAKNPAELTEEEKQFLNEHSDQLTPEQKETLGDVLDIDEEDKDNEATNTGENTDKTQINKDGQENDGDEDEDDDTENLEASELKTRVKAQAGQLKAAEDRIKALEADKDKKEVEEKITGMLFNENNKNGTLKPGMKDQAIKLMLQLNKVQRGLFTEFIQALPKLNSNLFSEVGAQGGNENRSLTASEEADKLVTEYREKNKEASYDNALTAVLNANPELNKKYSEELEGDK